MVEQPVSARRSQWPADLAVLTAVGLFLGLLGPFGSFDNGTLWRRLAYWVAMSWLGLALGVLAQRSLRPLKLQGTWRWTGLAGVAAVMAAVLTGAGRGLADLFWPKFGGGPALLVWYANTLVLTVGLIVFFALVRRPGREPSPAVRAVAVGGLLGVPVAQVLCLQMEDHYVRVHTAGGSRLVLATLGQAIEALHGAPGLRVHRSWWVADAAVAGAVAEGRNLRLILINGLSAPVSRTSVAAAREAGWLKPSTAATMVS